ncbi:MAG: hypothetical protein RLY95_961 [Pseudomonadota bacterium]|jgi:hemolysin activation/secretion protein
MKYKIWHALFYTLYALASFAPTAHAQIMPPVGDLSGNADLRSKQADSAIKTERSAPVPEDKLANFIDKSTLRVAVKSFVFEGNSAISSDELSGIVAAKLNQQLTFAGLEEVVDRITRHYRAKGFAVARAYLPPQKFDGGKLKIVVIEGRFDRIIIANDTPVSNQFLDSIIAGGFCNAQKTQSCTGKLIESNGLDRGLLLLRDLPGFTATANLKPGEAVGTSLVSVNVKLPKREIYSLSFDNYGQPSTGIARLNASLELESYIRDGDELSLSVATTNSAATKTGGASYSAPFNYYTGQRVGFAFSRNQYRLGAGFNPLLAHGLSNAISLYTSYPLARGISQSLYFRAAAEMRTGVNSLDTAQISSKTNANVVRVGVSGERRDDFGGGAYSAFGVTASQGYAATSDAADAGVNGAHSAGRFGKIAYNISRQQSLTGPVSLYTSVNGQQGNKNLDGSEQIGLGGPLSVRGYGGEAGGSSGSNGTIELRYSTSAPIGLDVASLTYAAFIDRGWVRYYQSPISTTVANTRALSSAGLSLTVQSSSKLPAPASTAYFLRIMLGVHSMNAASQSIVDPTSKGKIWIQGGASF